MCFQPSQSNKTQSGNVPLKGKRPTLPDLDLIVGNVRQGNTYISQGHATALAKEAASTTYNEAVDAYNKLNSAPRRVQIAQPRQPGIFNVSPMNPPPSMGFNPFAQPAQPQFRTVRPNFTPISHIERSGTSASKAIANAASLKGTRTYRRNVGTGQTEVIQAVA